MGIKIEEVDDNTISEEFFRNVSMDNYVELFPPDVADIAKETFGKSDYFYIAKNNNEIVGAMKFSIIGNVGHLDAIVIPHEVNSIRKEMIRRRLVEKFIDICSSCHRLFLWIPYQHKQAIGTYRKYGFGERFRAKKFWFENDYILMLK